MSQTLSPIDQLNTLETINYSQEGFERAAKAIIAQKETPGSIGNTLSEGIRKDPLAACANFYRAIESLKSDTSLELTPEREARLSHLARVVMIETLRSQGYTLSVQEGKYSLSVPGTPSTPYKDSDKILKSIGITDLAEAENVLTTIEQHKQEFHETLRPKIAPIKTVAQAQRQTLALQIDTGSSMPGEENARSTPTGGSFWDNIFGDSNISRNLNENTGPLVGLAAFFGLSKLFGLFDMKFGKDDKEGHGHGGGDDHPTEKKEKSDKKSTTRAAEGATHPHPTNNNARTGAENETNAEREEEEHPQARSEPESPDNHTVTPNPAVNPAAEVRPTLDPAPVTAVNPVNPVVAAAGSATGGGTPPAATSTGLTPPPPPHAPTVTPRGSTGLSSPPTVTP